ncbi:MAG TPA: hypothetical protein VN229_07815 [Terriglobales bacterium]|nr:hypothetical protein [Terriglobales bacterium]
MPIWIEYRDALVSCLVVVPRSRGDSPHLNRSIEAMAALDPLMSYGVDRESDLMVVGSGDVMHLPVLLQRLQQEHGPEIKIGSPQVEFRETISRPVVEAYTYRGPVGSAAFAKVKMQFDPLPTGTGFDFVHALGQSHPLQDYTDVIASTADFVRSEGPLAGYSLTDLRITLVDGANHETDSNPAAFRKAVLHCCRDALPKAQPLLLEPIMTAGVTIDREFIGDLLGALLAGHVCATEMSEDGKLRIKGPLASLLPYLMPTQPLPRWPGLDISDLAFDGFAPVPRRPDDEGPYAGALALRTGARLA